MSDFIESKNLDMLDQDMIEDPTFPYKPPCMKCQPIIYSTSLRFHNSDMDIPFKVFEDKALKFGTLEIKIRDEIPINKKHIHMLFSIDASGSMSEHCIDGRSKMTHIKHTLENMLRIFYENKDCNISIHVQSFDSAIKLIINDVYNIRDANFSELVSLVNNLNSGGSTNIGLALSAAKEHINNYSKINPEHELYHIFLTDGDITDGVMDYDELLSMVPNNCNNIFIGYGSDHDSNLLSHLARTKGNEYRFIDALEKAGLVYGEIIHGILYKAIEDVMLVGDNGEIYDFMTNSWKSKIEIGNLLSDQRKTIHIRSKTPERCIIKISGKTIVKTRQYQTINIFENQADVFILSGLIDITRSDLDLSIYIFRQKTQELLYEARKFSEKYKKNNSYDYLRPIESDDVDIAVSENIETEKRSMKEKLSSFHKITIEFMKKNSLETNSIMKMLCDDIYIAYKTIGTSLGSMYSCARQISNGREQTYMCATLTSQQNNRIDRVSQLPVPQLLRQINNHTVTLSDLQTQVLDFIPPKEEICDIDSYMPTQDFLSPFISNGVLTLMREVSGNYSIGHSRTDNDEVLEENA